MVAASSHLSRRTQVAHALIIWMNGVRVGTWDVKGGGHSFQYDPDWLNSVAARRLSLSLPFTPGNEIHRGAAVRNYFDNLLPDSDTIRQRLRQKFTTASIETFDLLSAIGRDCVGAVQILAPDQEPSGYDRIEAHKLDEAGVERAITASLSGAHLLGRHEDDNFRISIAGAQEKTALLFHGGHWCVPLGATPTTHILKLPLGLVGNMQADMHDSVENEWLCSRIIAAFNLPIAHCEIAMFGARKVLVVERFDRSMRKKEVPAATPKARPRHWIARLPQEDFCQATGIAGSHKYESDGGPGMHDILRILDGSLHAQSDKQIFVKAQILFWLLAATDGHAKNFSLFHERDGGYRFTPLYDVISAWPIIGTGPNQLAWHKAKLAMAVRGRNAHWKLNEILSRHWDTLARQAGLGDSKLIREDIAASLPGVIDSVKSCLPMDFPEHIARTIFDGMNANVGRLLA